MVLSRLRVSVAAVVVALSIGSVASADSLYSYNAVVTDQYNTSNHVEGAAFGKNVYTFSSPVFTGGLSVSGSLTSDGTYISINGSHLTTTSSLGSVHVNYNGGATAVVDSTLPAQMTALAGEIAADSAGYAAMASNGSVALGGSTLSFTNPANATGQLVFTVDLAANPGWFSTSNLQFKFDLGAADSAVVNVIGGGSLSPNQGSFNPQSTTLSSKLLWNFEDATGLTLNAAWYGSILGPSLTVNTNNQNIYGGVYVQDLNQYGGEIHVPLFTGGGPLPSPSAPVPLPAASFGGAVLLSLLAVRRKR